MDEPLPPQQSRPSRPGSGLPEAAGPQAFPSADNGPSHRSRHQAFPQESAGPQASPAADDRQGRRARNNALVVIGLTALLIGFTVVQAYVRHYDFPNFVLHAIFNLNFVLLLTLLVLLGRNLFKLYESRRTQRVRGALPVRLVLYTLALTLPLSLVTFISLSETLIAVAEKWFEPPIDRMLDDALETSEASLELACALAPQQVPLHMEDRVESIRRQIAEYKDTKRLHVPVRKAYVMAMGLLALAALFSATWAAFKVANGISAPISQLAETAQEIAEGHEPSGIRPVLGRSAPAEIHTLVDSFDHMHRTLGERTRQLEDAHRRLQTILSDISAGVMAFDGSGRITLVNRQAEAMLGPTEGTAPRQLEELLGQVRHSGHRAGPTELELSSPEAYRILSATVSPLETEKGSAVVVLEDLTQLIQAQRLAAWREVARRVAHEIKNPLTPIQLSAQRLRRRSADFPVALQDLVAECTETIVEEVETMRRLVSDFAQFARLPRARPQPTDLNALVRMVASLFQATPSASITLELAADLPRLMLDPDLMRQVLVNLLKNGLEATEGRGPVRLTTSVQPDLNAVRLLVSDEGPGMPPELLERVFLPYVSTKGEGTGLGLAIVHQIVTDHYGYIRVRSAPGQGTTVTLELPISR